MAKKKTKSKTRKANPAKAGKKTTKKKAKSTTSRKKSTAKKTRTTKASKKSVPKKARAATTKKRTATAKKAKSSARKGKTHLAARELRAFRELLMLKRAEILGDMDSMSRDALNSDSANLSHMPLHMADVGSDNYEQELTLGLVESERRLLGEINEALERIADRTYGVCEATGKPIGKARLNAKPWAKYCIEAAREMERNGRR